MVSTSNIYCRQIVEVIRAHGVRTVYCSPGSRNTPLLLAAEASEDMVKRVVIDERSAAFQAYGCALVTQAPVAVFCTSGTAVLDYAPAVAEAYYSGIPLIIVSADRPREWIDQDDSQTIRQYGILDNIVKGSYDVRAIPEGSRREYTAQMQWNINRIVNEAMLKALEGKPGPIHINVQLAEPLGEMEESNSLDERIVRVVKQAEALPQGAIRSLAEELAGVKIMLVAGFSAPDHKLDKAVRTFASYPNVAVFAETLANLHDPQPLSTMIDAVLCDMTEEQKKLMRPDIVISMGGALVSRILKQYLREYPPLQHWSIGHSNYFCDCFQCLTHRMEVSPASFFRQLTGVLANLKRIGCGDALLDRSAHNSYGCQWHELRKASFIRSRDYIDAAPWTDLKALDFIFSNRRFDNLFVSNGTVVRYSQLIPHSCHAEYCNRGVSGIDGSTSTAVGGAWAYKGETCLISGDISWLYDSGASALGDIPYDMRMIVMDNGGGGIFRFIKSTSGLTEEIRERYFCVTELPSVEYIADAYGIETKEASEMRQLQEGLNWLKEKSDFPRMLVVKTPPEESSVELKGYFSKNHQ